ncbi:alanine--glyoxylate aminotransferase family protein, partial [Microbacterium sp.]|uniref:pyridoxal-phosphate-dependent aminotransferase family protein n=1 Tax=Microbacterium sp. TaxID=51671 RepID=UPI0028120D98
MTIDPLDPPARLLMGPGPISAYPSVLRAMGAPLVGQYDPFMTAAMADTQELYRQVWATQNDATLLIDGTSRAGIEAALVSLIRPGDRVLVPVFGRFGHLLAEIAERALAEVHTIAVEWGQVFPVSAIEEAIVRVRPHVLALVQGDTSTTMNQPLDEVGALCAAHGVLFYTDATASLGGNPFEADAWGVDAATAGLQKCLGGPSGSAPITLSDRAVEVIRQRKRIEAGIREEGDESAADFIRSNYFDLGMVLDYWGPRRLNHHTEATSMLYAARECARVMLAEGRDAVIERHRVAGAAMLAGVEGLGLKVFGDVAHKMNNVVAVEIPDGVPGDAARAALLTDFGIEIGTSFGPLHGRVWRIGTMG